MPPWGKVLALKERKKKTSGRKRKGVEVGRGSESAEARSQVPIGGGGVVLHTENGGLEKQKLLQQRKNFRELGGRE